MDFSVIYEQYVNKIYRVCLGYVNDSEKARDLTQEIFIIVWQNLSSFRQESGIGTWIFRIATNTCLRSIEKEKRQSKIALSMQVEDNVTEEHSDEKLIVLKNAIGQLNEIDRIIITLFMDDVPQEKIAAITGLSHANVRVKVHRIKKELLKKFTENDRL